LGQREYAAILKAAGVKRIKFHGQRHTCTTLLLQAGTPVHVVSERLCHSKVQMTLEISAHVLPDMQRNRPRPSPRSSRQEFVSKP
jgi:integrase